MSGDRGMGGGSIVEIHRGLSSRENTAFPFLFIFHRGRFSSITILLP